MVVLHVLCTLLQVYTFGNGSGVGKGVTDPKQLTPWLVEGISSEIIVDISTGDGHCLALTQSTSVLSLCLSISLVSLFVCQSCLSICLSVLN